MVEPALCNPDLVDIGRLPQLGDDLLGCVLLPLNFPPLLDAIRPTARRATSMGRVTCQQDFRQSHWRRLLPNNS
jgi:hypothetical protein